MRITVYFFLVIHTSLLLGQQVISKKLETTYLEKAIELYQNRNYTTSLSLLDKYKDAGGEDAQYDYYQAVNKLKLERQDGEIELLRFVRKHQNHFLSTNAFFDLGAYYFKAGQYDNTIKYFNRVTREDLDVKQQDYFSFQKGYAHFQIGEIGQALNLFQTSVEMKGDYFFSSSYYMASIYNDQAAFDKVFEITSKLLNQKNEYAEQLLLLHINTLYQNAKWEDIITNAGDKQSRGKSYFNIQLSRFLGEAYFRLEKFRPAAEGLETHLHLSSGKMGAEAYFMLGKSYLELENDELALKYLKISGLKDEVYGKLSSYYLGLLYRRSGDNTKAIAAFQVASSFDEQLEIQTQSKFFAGKLSYQIKDYNKAIDFLKDFLDQDDLDPNDMQEGQEMISNAYLLTPDYDLAIAHMEKMQPLSDHIKKAYQKVTYKKANSLFNDQQFLEALELTKKSLSFPLDQEIAAKSHYLMGEIYFIKGATNEAKSAYLLQVNEYPYATVTYLSLYALGYIAYNDKRYYDAEHYFRQFVDDGDSTHSFHNDGKLRLADSYFVQKKWSDAQETYSQLQSQLPNNQGYLFFRLGQLKSYQKEYESARISFRNVLNQPGRMYKDQSLLAMADTYISQVNFDQALSSLDKIIEGYKGSDIISLAYNRRANTYFNQGKYEEALADYKSVLASSIRSKAAENAIFGIQSLIKSGYVVDDYDQLLSTFRINNPNNTNLENIDFEGAKSAYFNQKYLISIKKFIDFIDVYARSKSIDDAWYYLADSYFKLQNYEEAAIKFDSVTNHVNIYRSRSYDKRGKALIAMEKYPLAIENYRNFLIDASSEKDSYLANEGLMNAFLLSEDADSTVSFADKLIRSTWQTPGGTQKAYLAQGNAYFAADKFELAAEKFSKSYENNTGSSGAKAMYRKAVCLSKLGKYDESNELLFQLNVLYSGFEDVIDSGYLLIALNYITTGNLFQAKATVESIIKGTNNNSTLLAANELLMSIQIQEQEIISNADTTKTDSIK
ncbi:MAG: tetratricopeptide (TPR) repeat protein [Cyclobacteriaceae bacterium]|jgi:tetratricopeptide (TPR) repeat protein